MTDSDPPRVLVVGAGPAGLMAGTFTARAGLDTVIVSEGEPLLRRNAHLENVPGFPAGVNSRLFLDLLEEQAGRNGCLFESGRVTALDVADEGFELQVERTRTASAGGDGDGIGDGNGSGRGDDNGDADAGTFSLRAEYVVAASWADSGYLEGLGGVELTDRGSKTYVEVDECGRTGVEGLYAAGRIAGKPHQTVVAAGHGAEVALGLVDDSDVPFYHDWVAPEGYFTGRGRDVPPGCEEIDEAERRRRERESIERMREAFAEHHPDEPTMHPRVLEERREE